MTQKSAPPNTQHQWRIDAWFTDLSPEVRERLRIYNEEIKSLNQKLNLIPPKSLLQADLVHFADSIISSRLLMKDEPGIKRLFDIGSGAGFPGLVFSILFPETEVVLIEPDAKRVEFLNHAIRTLKISNALIEAKSFETLDENIIDFGVTRGFTTISKAILFGRKSFKKSGKLFHVKADEWGAELAEIPTQLCSIWSPSLVGEYRLPVGGARFAVLKTEKIR